MTAYVAMLRAVNVAGTGKLAMSDLRAIGEQCGFGAVRTYIASGNLLFTSSEEETEAKDRLQAHVDGRFGRSMPIFVRSAAELAEAAAGNPFDDDKPSRVMAHFIDQPPTQRMIDEARDIAGERIALGPRLLYVSYGEGIGKTRLNLPAVKLGTARNLNSVTRMAALLGSPE
ncbi:MAG: DUF1697 domain-containing protein [Sphingomicrobium sp.]